MAELFKLSELYRDRKLAHTINTFDDLRNEEPSVNRECRLVFGNAVVGDGDGGIFYYDSADAATADDDLNTIVTTGGARWKRVVLPVATEAQGALADTAIQPGDNISELTNDTNYLVSDPTLVALAAVVTAANKLIYSTGVDTFATATLTPFARTLLDDADAETSRSTLGLGSAATQSVSSIAESQELATNHVKRVTDITALRALTGMQANQTVEMVTTGRAGLFRWDSSNLAAQVTADTQMGIYVPPTSDSTGESGAWVRVFMDGRVHLEWFELDYTGQTDMRAKIQAAVAATPVGGTLVYPSVEGTLLIDIPSGQSISRPAGVFFDKPMHVIGGGKLVTKVADFCAAWQNYTGMISAYCVTSSDVTVTGVSVNANADKHYEVDAGGKKWWEEGPNSKRPPGGISIYAAPNSAIVKKVVVDGCRVTNCLDGVAVFGSVSDVTGDDAFIDGSLGHSFVENCVIKNCIVDRFRGNAYLFGGGVRASTVHDNLAIDGQYHVARFYDRCIDCHAFGNVGNIDYANIAARYNQTDLGYWRTDDNTAGNYAIQRTGLKIGSLYTNSTDGKGNVRSCSMHSNIVTMSNTGAVAQDSGAPILSTINDTAPLFVENSAHDVTLNNNKILGEVIGAPYVIVDTVTTVAGRPKIYRNEVANIRAMAGAGGISQAVNADVSGNEFVFRTDQDLASLFTLARNGCSLIDNRVDYDTSVSGSMADFANLTAEIDGYVFIDGNDVSGPVGNVLDGSNGSAIGQGLVGMSAPPVSGWVNASGSGEDYSLSFNIRGERASLRGTIDGSASTSDVFYNIDAISSLLRPRESASGLGRVVIAGTTTTVGQLVPIKYHDLGQFKLVGFTGTEAGTLAIQIEWPVCQRRFWET